MVHPASQNTIIIKPDRRWGQTCIPGHFAGPGPGAHVTKAAVNRQEGCEDPRRLRAQAGQWDTGGECEVTLHMGSPPETLGLS